MGFGRVRSPRVEVPYSLAALPAVPPVIPPVASTHARLLERGGRAGFLPRQSRSRLWMAQRRRHGGAFRDHRTRETLDIEHATLRQLVRIAHVPLRQHPGAELRRPIPWAGSVRRPAEELAERQQSGTGNADQTTKDQHAGGERQVLLQGLRARLHPVLQHEDAHAEARSQPQQGPPVRMGALRQGV